MPGAACTALTKAGEKCHLAAEPGEETCRFHGENVSEIMSEYGKRSQKAQRADREARKAERPKPTDLRTVEQIQEFLEWSLESNDSKLLRVAPQIAKAAKELIDVAALEKENAELRAMLAAQGALRIAK